MFSRYYVVLYNVKYLYLDMFFKTATLFTMYAETFTITMSHFIERSVMGKQKLIFACFPTLALDFLKGISEKLISMGAEILRVIPFRT